MSNVRRRMSFLSNLLGKKVPSSLQELIAFLGDRNSDLGSRDDVAMDLGRSDEPAAEEALLRIVLDHTEDEMIIDSAGDSLREIWERQGKQAPDLVAQMHPAAQKFFPPLRPA
jgi:hypothetical protein